MLYPRGQGSRAGPPGTIPATAKVSGSPSLALPAPRLLPYTTPAPGPYTPPSRECAGPAPPPTLPGRDSTQSRAEVQPAPRSTWRVSSPEFPRHTTRNAPEIAARGPWLFGHGPAPPAPPTYPGPFRPNQETPHRGLGDEDTVKRVGTGTPWGCVWGWGHASWIAGELGEGWVPQSPPVVIGTFISNWLHSPLPQSRQFTVEGAPGGATEDKVLTGW